MVLPIPPSITVELATAAVLSKLPLGNASLRRSADQPGFLRRKEA
jgi:hypothetical protein